MYIVRNIKFSKRNFTITKLLKMKGYDDLPRVIEKCISRAIHMAQDSEMLFRHGCVIYKGGKEISSACNSNQTRCCGDNVSSLHAERSACLLPGYKWREKCLQGGCFVRC